jgi:uncharacterized repeat protein (TIGR03803 family)
MRIAVLCGGLLLASPALGAPTFGIVGSVTGGPQIGGVRGGLLYGTIAYGGTGGSGALFKLPSKGGTATWLHNFAGTSEGSTPNARLALDAKGDIFGTNAGGGTAGFGTIWEWTKGGALKVVHTFGVGVKDDGNYPYQGPTMGPDDVLYGSTSQGAIGGSGNLWSAKHGKTYAVVYNFLSQGDGHCPFAGVAVTAQGAIYGETVGLGFGGNPTGSVFDYTKTGGLQTLYVFDPNGDNDPDGEWPTQSPTVDAQGNVYGVTSTQNGASFAGAIWTITASGAFSVLYDLNGATDGYTTNSPLLIGSDGNLYGTTSQGGQYGYGTVFSITPGGTFTMLHAFTAGTDGAQPTGNLVMDSSGVIYGGTDYGPVFSLTP